MADKDKICAIVVTHNRKAILHKSLKAIITQKRPPDLIILVDNASTDGTEYMIRMNFTDSDSFKYVKLGNNLGGAGGFHYGAKLAFGNGADWIWMMDDDCVPEIDCLEKLLKGIINKRDIYSPIVLSSSDKSTTLWGIKARVNTGNVEVITLPFNGFLIHRDSIKEIGLPDRRFFIYGDDTEYNLRAKASGRKITMVTESIMYHPHKNKLSGSGIISMFSSRIWVYYKLRNAIIIYKKYRYVSMNQVIMFIASFCFFILTLNFKQIGLWIRALIDGLCNRLYVRDL